MLRPGIYTYTVESFFYTNLLWRIREVDLTCYTEYKAADAFGARVPVTGLLLSHTRVISFLAQLVSLDDFIDVFYLDGTYIRNIHAWLNLK